MGTPCLNPNGDCPSKNEWLGTIRCSICNRVAAGLGVDDKYYCEDHLFFDEKILF